ncbi:hypothetical protein LCGC14_0459190 [marine sediment metagenome]|uniref:Uncharacterized protein n=1 Tax=marine sediment metagenome TaxID=412755 RepID=A0A0F9SFJ4_9ZZZZ
MSESFLANFIAECVNDGKTAPNEMCDVAEGRIKKANREIKKIEELRLEKIALYTAIRQLGGKTDSRREYKNVDFSIPEDKLAEHYRVLCVNICDLIENNPEGLLIENVMDIFHSMKLASLEENELVYFAIKWLGGRSIIDKDSNMRLVKGDNWENRPHASNK